MEHIVQFGISIDDEAIKRNIEESAKKRLVQELAEDVKGIVFGRDRYGRCGEPNMWVAERFDKFLEAHKDEIIELAVNNLASRLVRTKAAKEALGKILEGEN